MRVAVVYWRHRSEHEVDQNTGPAERQRRLAEVARRYGWSDSQIEIIDDDVGRSRSSAETLPGWQRLQDMIDANQVGAVFVATISRLSRRVMEFELFRLRAALRNTLLYTDGQFIDLAGARDRIVSEIVSMRDRWLATQKSKGPVRK